MAQMRWFVLIPRPDVCASLALILASAAASPPAGPEPVPVAKVFHEAEVGWASGQLAVALDIPILEAGFSDRIRQLSKAATRGTMPTFDQTSEMFKSAFKGITPGATTRDWIALVDIQRSLAPDNPEAGVIGDGSINALLLPIAEALKDTNGVNPNDVAMLSKGVLLLLTESDFLLPSGTLFHIKKDDFVRQLLLTDDQRRKLEAFRIEAERRHETFGRASLKLTRTLLKCRAEKRVPTAFEEAEMIRLIDDVRKVGTVSQSAWWLIIRTSHSLLRLSGVPAEVQIDTPFAKYLRKWEAELPECNPKRWLRQAVSGGREIEPEEIVEGGLMPVAEP